MGRRLIVLCLVVSVALGAAALALARIDADPLQSQEWWLPRIGADAVAPPGPGVPIFVVDSGVDPTHPEFAGRPATTFLNDQTVVGGDEFHGTAVASVAAAPENGVGIVGVYPRAALDVYDASPTADGVSDFNAIAGIDLAAQHCPAVISISFSSTQADPDLRRAIVTAFHNGCLVVASAGNSGQTGNAPMYPAGWPHVFTVGATDQNDVVAPFSTLGPGVDIAAPGVGIVAAVPTSKDPSGYSSNLAGTSFATPMVAAAAAWVWTVRPTLSATQLAGVLREGAKDIGAPGFDNASGAGLLNIPGALAAATPPADPGEPNDDVDQVKPGVLFPDGEPALTSSTKQSSRIAGMLDGAEDPDDLYRIWIPAHKVVRVAVTGSAGAAAVRIWGPRTVSVDEGIAARRRDLRGPSMRGGRSGVYAYAEVLLTGARDSARYTLAVTATKH